jgi:choline dehydrogenase-like flavoprotein
MGVVVRDPPLTSRTTLANLGAATASSTDAEARHRLAIETPPSHVGLMGLLFPWMGSKEFPVSFSGQGGGLGLKLGMLSWHSSATFIALPRDRSQARNRVTIDDRGNAVLHYEMTPEDTRLVMVGLEMNLRILRAAGAKFMYIAHESFPWHHAEAESDTDDESVRFEAYLQAVRREGLHTAKMQIFSAHQMSSCRMAPTPATGPVSPSGELYECAGLFVADASVLPTSLGINPMVTIEATAHMIAHNIVREVGEKHPELEKVMRSFRASHSNCNASW